MGPTPITPNPAPIPPTAKPSAPGTVITAQVLMWLHFAAAPCLLGGVAMAMLLRMSDVESGPIRGAEAAAMLSISLGALLIPAAVLTLVGILAVKILRGRRWARTATLVFNGICIALGLIALRTGSFIQPLFIIGIEGTIAACLCTPTAKGWFTRDLTEPINPLVAAGAESRD